MDISTLQDIQRTERLIEQIAAGELVDQAPDLPSLILPLYIDVCRTTFAIAFLRAV